MKLFLLFLFISFNLSFLHATEPSFKFTLGGNLGNFPIEINKMSENTKIPNGIKINSWIISPNFLSITRDKKIPNFFDNYDSKENLYIKLNFKF
jgi:hypothetical protein